MATKKSKRSEKDLLFRSEVVWVNAVMALDLLSRMITQRPVNKDQLKMLVEYMVNGEWYNLGDPIRMFGDLKTGRTIDGQHRLLALVEAVLSQRVPEDFEIPLVFVFNCDDQMEKINVLERQRKLHEALACAGYEGINSAHVAVIKKILDQRAGGNEKHLPDVVEKFWARHHSLVKFVTDLTMAGGRVKKKHISTTATAAAIFNAIAYGEMTVKGAKDFFDALYYGWHTANKPTPVVRILHELMVGLRPKEKFDELSNVPRMHVISAVCKLHSEGLTVPARSSNIILNTLVPEWKKLKGPDGKQMIPTQVVIVENRETGESSRVGEDKADAVVPSRNHPTKQENLGRYVKYLSGPNDKAKATRLDKLMGR